MAQISYGCYLGYAIGDKVSVKTFQHFNDTEDWKWRNQGDGISIHCPETDSPSSDVNLFINISGVIDSNLISGDYPTYTIDANNPGMSFLQSYEQVLDFRKKYREVLDKIRYCHGESVLIHLYPATPNPINFEIGKGIKKNLDPTIILYDKTSNQNRIDLSENRNDLRAYLILQKRPHSVNGAQTFELDLLLVANRVATHI